MNKPIITIVVAMNMNRVIGVNNQLPWNISEDLQHFKKITMGKPIIMGRKTFDSIGRVLPGRKNIVISRNANFVHSDVLVYNSLLDAINDNSNHEELCIIGGGEIFTQAIQIADIMHVTFVDLIIDGNATYFPFIDLNAWQLYQSTEIITTHGVKCCFNVMYRCDGGIDIKEYCNKLL